ncbi:Ankyrin repeat and fibronectin type-III domain-containing protein 1 [Armadillidium vulgare]|nr:Ankyrin repeat and fibronectin type-III domain-containing protein 1 [Armadillidium vulgare]
MVGGNYPKETEKEHLKWERRVKFLRKMKSGLEKLQIPKAPQSASVEVIDGTRVRIGFQESQQPLHQQNVVITKYKVEWSVDEWKNVEGHVELFDLRRMSAVIEGLSQGRRHHFRICAGNVRGYGPTVATTPPSAVPSSWRDIDNRKPRMDGLLWELEDLFKQVRNSRPEHASEIKAIEPGQETPLVQRKAQKKKSLMQLFTHAPKFQKSLKRGSYFACIVFCDDKILVTTEDFPPVVEVDENYLSQAKIHFHWLMKVATTWEDVKSLRQDMEQAGSASHLPYRIKLLQAAANMQSVLGLQDLGQFYHKPIKDSSGTYVFCTVKHVKSTKAVSAMNVRWVPLAKLREKKTTGQGTNSGNNETPLTAGDMLINSLQEQITYSQVSQVPLRRGLYLGYLKLQSSVDQEEWEWLQNLKQHSWRKSDDPGGGGEKDNSKNNDSPSPAQAAWRKQLVSGVQRLLQELNIEEGKWSLHRLFTGEVLELNSDVTLLLLLPPLDAVCCVPGQEDILLTQASLMALPLHTFEMVHMGTYQGHLLGRYTRLSYILEMDMVMAQHSSREAFSEIEVSRAKERLWQLKQFQVLLDGIWKRFRWVMDVITFARDKAVTGLPLTALCQSIGQKSGNHFMDTSEIVLNSLSVSKEYKRFSYDSRFSSGKIKTNYGVMLKSKTAENIRQLASDSESRLPKSKTSDCVFLSSESLTICSSSDNYSQQNPSSECIPPIIQWKAEDTCLGPHESHMYTKNTLATKSDYLLQQYSEIEPPPRKSSAPSFLGSDTEQTLPGSEPLPRSKSSVSNYNLYSNSSSSLNTLGIKVEEKSSRGTIGERSLIPIGKGSPSTSCSNLTSQKFSTVSGNTEKRASSSMSHESAASFSSMSPASLRSVSSSNDNETDGGTSIEGSAAAVEEERAKRPNEPAIIQVYAAYDTGLAPGTSVKLHVTPRTTCREVIDLVVKQLNMAVLLKNKNGPIYGNEKLKDFCLVAVIGARERCLRDDFRPVQLQNPWKKGRLFVRLRNDVLAAIEQNNAKHTSYL